MSSILDDLIPPEPKKKPAETLARQFIPQEPGVCPEPDNDLADVFGPRSPGESTELDRITRIPRRKYTPEQIDQLVDKMTAHLRHDRHPKGSCGCAARGRKCILRLNPAQAWALYEMSQIGGLIAPIKVGGGKTGLNILASMVVPNTKTAVLLVPPNLVDQLKAEYLHWRDHWKVPSLLIKGHGWIEKGRPAVHVVPYSRFSRSAATVLLDQLSPDLIIADEADKLRNHDTATVGRFLRYFANNQSTRFVCWSGSFLNTTIKDFSHLSGLALKLNSPLPLDKNITAEWAAAIDPPAPGGQRAPMGALAKLCEPGETLESGFRRRFLETPGVVSNVGQKLLTRLTMHRRDPGDIPDNVEEAIRHCRGAWERPDGEMFTESFQMIRCARELACGFYYKWIFPRGESPQLIEDWLGARRAWASEVRSKLRKREEHLDSPQLLQFAAQRFYRDPEYGDEIDPQLPTWDSLTWPEWRKVKGLVKPKTKAVWLDTFLVEDAVEWAHRHKGIVWYSRSAFGHKLAEIGDMPMHSGGKDAERKILAEKGGRPIAASIKSHGRGRDGLQYRFTEQLVSNPPESQNTGGAASWEQLLGRLHRQGQTASEVRTFIYRHTSEIRDAWDRAKRIATFVQNSIGSFQKLMNCEETWTN